FAPPLKSVSPPSPTTSSAVSTFSPRSTEGGRRIQERRSKPSRAAHPMTTPLTAKPDWIETISAAAKARGAQAYPVYEADQSVREVAL
ncbi:MAG TPA: hypothetical protein VMA37_02095, partial [Acetobacteraceae bacterium]|nr:hypothetical protein [Acetobacteraceae bacterium]